MQARDNYRPQRYKINFSASFVSYTAVRNCLKKASNVQHSFSNTHFGYFQCLFAYFDHISVTPSTDLI